MNESQLRAQLNQTFQRLYLWPLTTPDSPKYPSGRPDTIICNWHGACGAIEYKLFNHPGDTWGATSFEFGGKIEPGQYAWMAMAAADGARHLYLGLGTRHGTAGSKKDPRLAWVIPWDTWLEVEWLLRPIQASLPLVARKGLRREIQERGLAAIPMLSKWRMAWQDGGWHFPHDHRIYELATSNYQQNGYRDLKQWRNQWRQTQELMKSGETSRDSRATEPAIKGE